MHGEHWGLLETGHHAHAEAARQNEHKSRYIHTTHQFLPMCKMLTNLDEAHDANECQSVGSGIEEEAEPAAGGRDGASVADEGQRRVCDVTSSRNRIGRNEGETHEPETDKGKPRQTTVITISCSHWE